MENIIEAVIQIKEQAEIEVQAMQTEREALPSRIQAEIARRKAAIDKRTEITIGSLYKAAAEESERRIRAITAASEQKRVETEQLFEKRCQAWRESIFSRIVGENNKPM